MITATPLPLPAAIGRRIRARRRRLRMSQRELGQRIYISDNTISLLERGVGNVSGYLAGIAEALGVTEGWLRQ